MLPALSLVLWSAALIASGAWQGAPQLKQLGNEFGQPTVAKIAWILLASLVTGLFLHPLQFAMVQLLEGYWGHTRIARILALIRIDRYRRKQQDLEDRQESVRDQLEKLVDARIQLSSGDAKSVRDEPPSKEEREDLLDSARGADLAPWLLAIETLGFSAERYPAPSRIMPTRLGNALRREEDRAGRQYGLDAVLTAPHFGLIADERHLNYLRDSRQQLDTSVRLCIVSALATIETVACLLTDGWWLFAALATHALSYLAYRASVSAADEYTTALGTLIDLNRFKLYETLHIGLPISTNDERRNNARLMELLAGKHQTVSYKHPAAGTPSTGAAPPTPPGTP
ncbi:hypothetical protein VA596_34615 [Amycolatopsis sp., V23-08]|uniref:DUF4231 domain-containing protein n=1 Tax=Amycolatopsis heterodermiae TaxID=3110235 RepID=A0ABU5REK5_9PSEU|nr:hypothetical protein [Amycolatopsis sp., V23-08]MEA5364708.1 hypothetical protein [Amycolatopsis sp., V23-08]